MHKYDVKFYSCDECGFMQTEEPYWLKEAYESPISESDTGLLMRNIHFSIVFSVALRFLNLNLKGRFLDFGGGHGVFARLMRDNGFDFFWFDKHAENIFAKGFEGGIGQERYEAITSLETFEHLIDPKKEIQELFIITDHVLFSTELLPEKVPSPETWWYYCLEHGQHISFFSKKSLEFLARKNGFYFLSAGNGMHLLSKYRVTRLAFILTKIVLKLKLERFFFLPAKTVNDMKIAAAKGLDSNG